MPEWIFRHWESYYLLEPWDIDRWQYLSEYEKKRPKTEFEQQLEMMQFFEKW